MSGRWSFLCLKTLSHPFKETAFPAKRLQKDCKETAKRLQGLRNEPLSVRAAHAAQRSKRRDERGPATNSTPRPLFPAGFFCQDRVRVAGGELGQQRPGVGRADQVEDLDGANVPELVGGRSGRQLRG
jgi:hypothetical protein